MMHDSRFTFPWSCLRSGGVRTYAGEQPGNIGWGLPPPGNFLHLIPVSATILVMISGTNKRRHLLIANVPRENSLANR